MLQLFRLLMLLLLQVLARSRPAPGGLHQRAHAPLPCSTDFNSSRNVAIQAKPLKEYFVMCGNHLFRMVICRTHKQQTLPPTILCTTGSSLTTTMHVLPTSYWPEVTPVGDRPNH